MGITGLIAENIICHPFMILRRQCQVSALCSTCDLLFHYIQVFRFLPEITPIFYSKVWRMTEIMVLQLFSAYPSTVFHLVFGEGPCWIREIPYHSLHPPPSHNSPQQMAGHLGIIQRYLIGTYSFCRFVIFFTLAVRIENWHHFLLDRNMVVFYVHGFFVYQE